MNEPKTNSGVAIDSTPLLAIAIGLLKVAILPLCCAVCRCSPARRRSDERYTDYRCVRV